MDYHRTNLENEEFDGMPDEVSRVQFPKLGTLRFARRAPALLQALEEQKRHEQNKTEEDKSSQQPGTDDCGQI